MKKRIFAVLFSLFMVMAYSVPARADVIAEPEPNPAEVVTGLLVFVGVIVLAVVVTTVFLLLRYFSKRNDGE